MQSISCSRVDDWESAWSQVQQALDASNFVVALLSYETGAQLQAIASRKQFDQQSSISQFLVFKRCQQLGKESILSWLEHHSQHQIAGIRQLQANVTVENFTSAIEQIRAYIAAGDTYQVNYTYRLHFQTYGSALSLYLALRRRQPVPYGAFIHLPDGSAILSLSPELFIRHTAGHLFARPMKGTAAACGDDLQDQQAADNLRRDPKNRAENLMIVDLLRNDLGRIASTGSVKVPALFEVNRFSSVLQMTSSIEAQLRPELNLAEVMRALFPCGSITGAPKHRTMEIIRELETEDRGIYTGAIGWFDPPTSQARLGDFCLSVPIRTLQLSPADAQGSLTGCMGVGAGIVYDSRAEEEFAECQLKAKFLTGLQPEFELFETMFATHADGCRHLERHLQRLERSADFFGFAFDRTKIVYELQTCCASFTSDSAYRLRLGLQPNGQIQIQHAQLQNLNTPVKLFFKNEVCETETLFLKHKSSHRQAYDAAWKAAEQAGGFDSLFVNRAGYVTEGGRSNVFVRIGQTWYTPPLNDGVLPGIMRAVLLDDPHLQAQEKSLTIEELLQADEIMLCNALRGALPAIVVVQS
ncbi:aminodeoxychorismate synthase component I [Undibacterium sp. Di24W]|uniref:aminodeoxychorismate synthase component I n=1 Tax=Undibacterium sp. Di24W TaxID=3413033 RepID=UPI003BF2B64E